MRAYISEQGASYVIPPQSNLTHWPQSCHHAFTFRYVNSYCVHVLLLCD
ncbi:hypothetical protein [uncultured Oscillibacter sp.]